MAYSFTNSKGQQYFLHANTRTSKSGKEVKLYFFSREIKAGKDVSELPAGYKVVETERTGMPVLKKA